MLPKLRECSRQVEAEVVSNSSSQLHQTWGPWISRSLYFQPTTLPDVNLFDNFPRLVGHQLEELAARDARLAARPVPGSLAEVVVGRSRGNAVILGCKRKLFRLLESSFLWPKRSDTACFPLFLPKTLVAFGIASFFYQPFQSPSFRRTAENVS